MKKWIILFIILYCLSCIFLAGCVKFVKMNVDSYSNPELNIAEYKRFSFLPVNKDKPLFEKQLFSIIKDEMEKKGYFYDEKRPQFLVAVQHGVNIFQEQKPVRSRPVQVYQPPPIGSKPGTYGSYQTQYVTEGGGSRRVNIRWMKIDFIDKVKKKRNDEILYLWQGEVNSEGSGELSEVAKCLIYGLLLDYPTKSDRMQRTFRYEDCK